MSSDPRTCPKSPNERHLADGLTYSEGDDRRTAKCEWCGAGIRRAHKRSTWWRLDEKKEAAK